MTIGPPSDSTADADVATLAIDLHDGLDAEGLEPSAVDEAFALLAEHRRRLTLSVVRNHDEAITLPDVADEVAVRESGQSLPQLSAQRVAEVYISIYHDHLPRLVDAGLLRYDQERDLVEPAY